MAPKPIGSTFAAELAAAGLTGLPFSWNPTGDFIFDPAMTAAQISAVEAVYAAHDANKQSAPNEISDRQFFQQLAVAGIITQSDALAAVKTGTLPSALASLVGAMPEDQQFAAQMMLSGSVVFHRDHPLVGKLGVAYGWTDAQIDALWVAAALL